MQLHKEASIADGQEVISLVGLLVLCNVLVLLRERDADTKKELIWLQLHFPATIATYWNEINNENK